MTDTQWTPRPPDINRRTLTPVGYAVCVAVPVLVAVVGLTLLWLNYDEEDLVDGTRLPILTSEWQAGDAAMTALFRGELVLGEDRCTYLGGDDGTQTVVVWPAGFAATVERVGRTDQLKVYDTDRTIVARGGNTIEFGGGSVPVGDLAGRTCAPESGDVLVVQSDVTVVPGS